MADYVVRFIGDLGNLAQFNSSIQSSLLSNSQALSRANSQVASQALGAPIQSSGSGGVGYFIKNAATELDQYNKAIVQSGQVVYRYIKDYEVARDSLGNFQVKPIFGEQYFTNFRLATASLEQYARAAGSLNAVDQAVLEQKKIAANTAANLGNVQKPLTQYAKNPTEENFAKVQGAYQQADRQLLFGGPPGSTPITAAEQEAHLLASLSKIQPLNFSDAELKFPEAIKARQEELRLAIQQEIERVAVIQDEIATQVRTTTAKLTSNPIYQSLLADISKVATTPEGYLGTNAATALNNPAIRNDLIKKANLGLGQPYGTQGFFKAAQSQEFNVSSVSRDLERNLTTISGTVKSVDGVLQNFTYRIGENGKAINSWGRQLSGSKNFLTQTGRDVLKFTEWVVAATVVMGAFSVAIGALHNINELNSNLQRLSITLRLNRDETVQVFKSLSDVAYRTATPLQELVKASDDIALATRRANQTTQEWKNSFLEMANAVGILTNISGLDTVKATDLLTASMKQLSLTTNQLVPLLNQITAAAGGQANSIADIAQALGSVSEAATEAGLSTTQQIAAVQVISQVTGKSAADTATAFKNLFGAINSDAAIKELKNFGIAVRDNAGNLRPFLDIYKDIEDKFTSGVIPEGRINEVLRAISGGPRRSPDAAALLSNVYKVFDVQSIAENASNEALIANAQILDTNKAKIIQFQNAFETNVYEKFNQTIRDLTGTLVSFGTVVANVFGAIPTPLITLTTALLGVVAAITALQKVSALLGISAFFGNLTERLVGLPNAAKGASVALAEVEAATVGASSAISFAGVAPRLLTAKSSIAARNLALKNTLEYGNVIPPSGPILSDYYSGILPLPPRSYDNYFRSGQGSPIRETGVSESLSSRLRNSALGTTLLGPNTFGRSKEGLALIGLDTETKGLIQRFIGVFSSRGGKFAAGAAIGGAGALAASGQSDFASALASLGQVAGGALLFNPATAPIGAGLLVGSTLIQTFTQNATQSAETLKKQTSDLQVSLYNLTEQWKQDQAGVDAARTSYNNISDSLRKAKVGTSEYIDLQSKLGAASLDLSSSLDQQHQGLSKIVSTLKQLYDLSGGKGPDYASFINNIGTSGLTKDQLSKLTGLLSQEIFKASGQGVYNPNLDLNLSPYSSLVKPNNDLLTYTKGGPFGGSGSATAEQLLNDPNIIKDIVQQAQHAAEIGYKQPYTNPLVDFPFGNAETVAAFETGLGKLVTSGDITQEAANTFLQAVHEFAPAAVIQKQNIQNAQATIQGSEILGTLSGDKAQNAELRLTLSKALLDASNKPAPDSLGQGGGRLAYDRAQEEYTKLSSTLLTLSNAILNNGSGGLNTDNVAPKQLQGVADSLLSRQESPTGTGSQLDFLKSLGDTAYQSGVIKLLRSLNITDDVIKKLNFSSEAWHDSFINDIKDMQKSTQDFADSQLKNVGDKLLNLEARRLGGEFKATKNNPNGPKEYAALLAQYTAEAEAITTVTNATKKLEEQGNNFANKVATNMVSHLNALKINGFLGVKGSIDQVSAAFFNMIGTLNLSGPQIKAVVSDWVRLLLLVAQAAALADRITAEGVKQIYTAAQIASFPKGERQDAYRNNSLLKESQNYQQQIDAIYKSIQGIVGHASGTAPLGGSTSSSGGGGGTTKASLNVGTIYLSDEQRKLFSDPAALIKQAYANALKLQAQIPGEKAKDKNDIVVVFDGLQKIFQKRGISEELLRKALDDLTKQMQDNTKADSIRRVRIGSGDFSAIANVPVNSVTGISANQTSANIFMNIVGTVLTPAQLSQFADQVAAALKRQL